MRFIENNTSMKPYFVSSIFSLFISGTTVVIGFAMEFGRNYGNIAYEFAPPFVIIYILYLLGAFIATDSLQGKINRGYSSFIEYVFILYLTGAVGIWALSHSLIFALSLLTIGASSALGFMARYFHVIYPSIILIDAIVFLNDHCLLLALAVASLIVYTLILFRLIKSRNKGGSKSQYLVDNFKN